MILLLVIVKLIVPPVPSLTSIFSVGRSLAVVIIILITALVLDIKIFVKIIDVGELLNFILLILILVSTHFILLILIDTPLVVKMNFRCFQFFVIS